MKRLLILVVLGVSFCSTASAFQGGGGQSTKKGSSKNKVATKRKPSISAPAKPGFFIQFEMCHACAFANWQKHTIAALANRGIKAFVSDDISSHYTEQSYWTLQSLRLRRVGNEAWPTPVYAGPFQSELSARQTFSRLPAILTPVFDAIDKLRSEMGDTDYKKYFSRRFADCSGNQCDIFGFFVQLVRVSD